MRRATSPTSWRGSSSSAGGSSTACCPTGAGLAAILTQVLPFAVMHLGKAEPEALGSIIAAVALGVLALRTRSFWYGAVIHGIVAVLMDWLSAWPALLGA